MNYSVLVIGDVHFPWVNTKSLKRVIAFAGQYKPKYIVQMGDLYDLFSFSRFPRTHNLITPKDEIDQARKMGEKFWRDLQKISPKSTFHQVLGNHDIRPHKKIIQVAPEFESLLDLSHLWKFEGVHTQPDDKTELILRYNNQKICFIHGYRTKLGDHAKFNHMNTVCGHTHRGGVVHIPQLNVWELNAGFIGDPTAVSLSYTAQRKFSNWTQGIGYIDEHGPRFIHF